MAIPAHEIQQKIAGLHQLPAMPPLARELLRPDALRPAEIEELSGFANIDRVLGRALVDTANAIPGAPAVRQPAEALVRLGLGGARKAVFRALAYRLFPPEGGTHLDRRAFWRHAVCCAAYAERIARRIHSPHVHDAYVAGLLHDIGRPALDTVVPGASGKALAMAPAQGLYLLEAERREFGVDHTLAGKWLAEAWGLPEPFRSVVWLHHQPVEALEHLNCPVQLLEIVALADVLASVRLSGLLRVQALPAAAEEQRKRLGLDADALAQILASAPADLHQPRPELAIAAEASPLGALSQERLLRRYRALTEFTLSLSPMAARTEILATLAGTLREDLGLGAGLCLAVAPEANALEGLMWRSATEPPQPVHLPATAQGGAQTRQALFALLEQLAGGAPRTGGLPHGFLTVPMVGEGAQVGQIIFDAGASRLRGTAKDLEEVMLFARAAAVALVRAEHLRRASMHAEGLGTALWKTELAHRQNIRAERLASVGKMAAGAAHEINNPLAIIAGRAQLLLSRLDRPEDAKALDAIIEQTRRASKVLSDLLKFARPGELHRQPTLVNVLAHQVVDAMRERLEAARIQVVEDYAAGLPRTRIDRRQMEQVLVNLILNAEQAMPEGGELTLRLRPSQDRHALVLQVIDAGPGIPAEILDQVFEPFFTTRGDRGGTGLGLSVCHGIVEAHRGSITLHSAANGGTICTITLPVEAEDRQPQPVQSAAPPTAPEPVATSRPAPVPKPAEPVHAQGAPVVAIVDDDEDLRLVLGEALEARGYQVRLAVDGLEGLATLLSEPVDVLLLDLHVPNLDGISLLRQLRERSIKPAVIVLNAMASHEEVQEAMQLGARRAVQKPFEMSRLLAELDAVLNRRSVA